VSENGLLTADQAIAHLREDADADVAFYVGAAIQVAVDFLDRQVYADEASLQAAIEAVPAMLTSAEADWNAAKAAANDLQGAAKEAAQQAADASFKAAQAQAERIYGGIVINEAIRIGMLMILGHLWRNREAVEVSPSAVAVEIPMGARSFLWPYRRGLGV